MPPDVVQSPCDIHLVPAVIPSHGDPSFMPFKVQVGPPQIAIHQAMTVLLTESDGQINWPSDKGLYFLRHEVDQRLVGLRQRHRVGPADRRRHQLRCTSRIFLTNRAFLTEDGPYCAPDAGVRPVAHPRPGPARGPRHHQPRPEAGAFQPGNRHTVGLRRCLRREGQARDIRRGHIASDWSDTRQTLRTTYRNADFMRSVALSVGQKRRPRGVRQRPPELRGRVAAGWVVALLPAV